VKIYGGVNVQLHLFLVLALDGGELSALCPRHFTPKERPPGTDRIGGCTGLRAGLDALEKIKFLEFL
jgi:hypothetical protein